MTTRQITKGTTSRKLSLAKLAHRTGKFEKLAIKGIQKALKHIPTGEKLVSFDFGAQSAVIIFTHWVIKLSTIEDCYIFGWNDKWGHRPFDLHPIAEGKLKDKKSWTPIHWGVYPRVNVLGWHDPNENDDYDLFEQLEDRINAYGLECVDWRMTQCGKYYDKRAKRERVVLLDYACAAPNRLCFN